MSTIPSRLDTLLRAGALTTHALSETARWLETRSVPALVLQGDPGSGKSVAAAWAFRHAYHRVRHSGAGIAAWPEWWDANAITNMRPWDERWNAIDAAPLVVIDDVGTEIGLEASSKMQGVLERLWNVSSGRMILTTNVSPPDFCERYGDRVRSRVAGSAVWVACAEDDMRSAPPTSVPFRRPEAETSSELVARLADEERKRVEDAEWEKAAPEREAWMARHMANLESLTRSKRMHVPVSRESEDEDEARVRIKSQLEQLRRDRGQEPS